MPAVNLTVTVAPEDDLAPLADPEALANSFTPNEQRLPDVAALRAGEGDPATGYVVVWRSYQQDNPGENAHGIFGQRFGADGVPLGTEFQVNTTIPGTQGEPQVAGVAGGGFAVVWTDEAGLDGSGEGVFLQLYDAAGQALGGETQVNGTATSAQEQPQIARLEDGSLAVVWSGTDPVTGSFRIYGQQVEADGTFRGPERMLSSESTGSAEHRLPSVSALPGGGFALAYQSQAPAGSETADATDGGAGIFLQRFGDRGLVALEPARRAVLPEAHGIVEAGGRHLARGRDGDRHDRPAMALERAEFLCPRGDGTEHRGSEQGRAEHRGHSAGRADLAAWRDSRSFTSSYQIEWC
ncbi:hypothetical protein [Mangrovicoccus ximenensis]|uniref:hypothetical protein n=1 Tax=Mangrovicoccus ximenensis TaxID=1911570 RepID=UPI001374BA0A